MKALRSSFFLLSLLVVTIQDSIAQCETWVGSAREDEAISAHSIYRPYLKDREADDLSSMSQEDFTVAFNNWKKAYEIAPAADGNRPTHYSDGRILYKSLLKKETDPAVKKEHAAMIMKLYDQQIECYKNDAFWLGRKAYDMFYMAEYGYSKNTYETFKMALEKGGINSEYIVFDPMGKLVVYLYQSKQIDKDEARAMYTTLEEIANHNIENNERYGQYYDAGFKVMASEFSKIEDEVFDCDYFKKKLIPEFEENPDDLEVIKYVFNKLRQEGCDTTMADMIALRNRYEELATEINAQLESKRREENPGYDAIQLQKEGKYAEAVARYQEAIEVAENDELKAQFYYSIAYIQVWQLGSLGSAQGNISKATSLKSDWGKPHLLMGDIYAKLSTGCKDDWDKRLAILAACEKYSYARSVDSEVSDEAARRLGNYREALPTREDGFMRKVEEGQRVNVPCLGVSTVVRYKN